MKPIILIHGGAGPDSNFIKENIDAYKAGLREALNSGYGILYANGSALEAVEAAVRAMEDNALFNCGRGSALNEAGTVEMCASIMDGKSKANGAIAIVKGIRHPVSVAKQLLRQKTTGFLGGDSVRTFGEENGAEFMPEEWFITNHQKEVYENNLRKNAGPSGHGTVGAVALDCYGNIAAATSTGGLEFCKSGRIADSGMIGAGCYANNDLCAVSCTGDGEIIIREVLAHAIASEVKYTGNNLEDCANEIIKSQSNRDGDLGAIVLDNSGNFAFCFNTKRMHRGVQKDNLIEVAIY